MEILCIKGCNIASLAKPFEIDFETGPLAGCGLFAITGKTGAGKSSLLDAMCLALYGDCPRLGSSGVNDLVPDPSGVPLSSTDARTLLRRGTAEGHATVRFRGRDGIDYEANWSVRRAHGKPTNRLQNADRALVRLSDGVVLENQVRRVNELVVELTGLTYEEFRRSVLLAQGDFDSFLSAKTSERAAILEKVTGTSLYREISKRVYVATQKAERAVSDLEIKLGEHQVLSDEERKVLEEQKAGIAKQRKQTAKSLKSIQADLEYYKALTEARDRLSKAESTCKTANQDWENAREDRALREEIRKSNSVRAEYRETVEARKLKSSAFDTLNEVKDKLTEANKVEKETRNTNAETKRVLEELEEQFKAFGPIWSKAEQLDAKITTALTEAQEADKKVISSQTDVSTKTAFLETKMAERDKLGTEIEQLQTAIEAEHAGTVLIEQWSVLEDRLTRRMQAARVHASAGATAEKLGKDIGVKLARKSELDELIKAHETTRKTHEEKIQKTTETRNALAEADPVGRLSRLTTGASTVGSLIELARRHDEAETAARNFARDIADKGEAIKRANTSNEAAQSALNDASSRISALEAPAELAEAAVSSEAQKLRRHLVDGQPCPVCQAIEHPVHAEGPAAELAQRLRGDLEKARKDRDEASTALVQCTASIETIERDRLQMEKSKGSAGKQALELKEEFCELAKTEAGGAVADRIPANVIGAKVVLRELSEKMKSWRIQLQSDCDALSKMDQEIEVLRRQVQTETDTLRTYRDERQVITDDTEVAEKEKLRAQDEVDAVLRTIGEIDLELGNRFGMLDLDGADIGSNGDQVLKALAERREAHQRNLEAMKKSETSKADLTGAIAIDEAALITAKATLSEANKTNLARIKAHSDLMLERSQLLGGQETGPHRTAFNERRKKAAEEREKTAEAHSSAEKLKYGLEAEKRSGETILLKAETRLETAEAELNAASQKIAISPERLEYLLSKPMDEVTQLEERISTLEKHRLASQETVKTRQTDIEAIILPRVDAQEDGSLGESLKSLQTRKVKVTAYDEESQKKEQDYTSQLRVDMDAKIRQAAIVTLIDEARQVRDTWAAVNDTVGSANGDKFSQIAQEVTLSILVEQANDHLEGIKPRYRLALGEGKLSLHVVDEDMAGEIRSTRSLSGGERFLVSLALALALSSVGGSGAISGTLFIDEGFGTLDAESLDLAIDALEALQAQGRMVGVISHVQAMKDRIPMQVRIEAQGDGSSEVVIAA